MCVEVLRSEWLWWWWWWCSRYKDQNHQQHTPAVDTRQVDTGSLNPNEVGRQGGCQNFKLTAIDARKCLQGKLSYVCFVALNWVAPPLEFLDQVPASQVAMNPFRGRAFGCLDPMYLLTSQFCFGPDLHRILEISFFPPGFSNQTAFDSVSTLELTPVNWRCLTSPKYRRVYGRQLQRAHGLGTTPNQHF